MERAGPRREDSQKEDWPNLRRPSLRRGGCLLSQYLLLVVTDSRGRCWKRRGHGTLIRLNKVCGSGRSRGNLQNHRPESDPAMNLR